jgi:hypothetical protein
MAVTQVTRRQKTKLPDRWALWALAGLAGLFGLLLGGQPRRAAAGPGGERFELHICNHSSEPRIYAAVAAYDPVLKRLVARGWFPQAAGKCRAVIRELMAPVYVFGESRDGSRRWGAEDGVEFCLKGDGPFVAAEGGCAGESRVFRRLDVDGGKAVQTWAIEDEARS